MRLAASRMYAKPAPVPAMPPGLVELMEGLAKDVLKNNPENIYEFCAGHMQKLLEIRDGPPPPKKQLTLEQKIAKAQKKIRQKIRDCQNEYDKNALVHSGESQEHQNEQHAESAVLNMDSTTHSVVHEQEILAKEVEIFHDPDGVQITKDNINEAATPLEVEKDNVETEKHEEHEASAKVHQEVIEKLTNDDIKHVSDIITLDETRREEAVVEVTEKVENKESPQNVYKELHESTSDDPGEVPDVKAIVSNEIKEGVLDAQILVTKENDIEYVGDEGKENVTTHNETGISEKAIVDTENAVNEDQDSQVKFAVVHAADKVSQNKDYEETQFVPSETTKTENNAEKKTIALDQGPLEKEVINHVEVTSEPLTNNSETKVPHTSDNLTIQIEDVEDKIIKKEQLTDTKHDDILINKDVNAVELVDKAHSTEEKKVDLNSEVLLPLLDATTAEEVSHSEQPPNQIENQLDGSHINPLTGTGTDMKPDHEVSVNGEDQVISVKIAEKVNAKIDDNPKNEEHFDTDDVHKTEINNVSDINKQIIDTDDKLPEQEHAHSREFEVKQNYGFGNNSTTVNQNDKIFESDGTTDNTAVSGMDLETAAITIQKVFRTFLFSKSRASTLDDTVNESLEEDIEKKDEPEYLLTSANINKERRTLGISRMDTVLQTVNEEKSLSLSDDSSLSSAATTIQAHVRGFLVRNRLASNKTASSSSLVNSDGPSTLSLDGDGNEPKKTILNIHIVPERGQFMSRDESLLTSIDLPLDNSPPSSINLHPLGYDKSERRKQLKREDAVQSISPPSNNSGKLSEELDSVKDVLNDNVDFKLESESIPEKQTGKGMNNGHLENKGISNDDQDKLQEADTVKYKSESISMNDHDKPQDADTESCETTLTISSTAETVVDAETFNTREVLTSPEHNLEADRTHEVVVNSSSDEMDVVTPFPTMVEKSADTASDEKPKLIHSGEFHDIVVQTQVKRTESSVVREFKNVLVYFLLWDKT